MKTLLIRIPATSTAPSMSLEPDKSHANAMNGAIVAI